MTHSPSRFGLRAHLLALILLTLGPAFALTLHGNLEARRQVAGEVGEQVLRLARQISRDQGHGISLARQLLVTVGRLPEFHQGNHPACSPLAAELLAQQPRFTNLGVIALDGRIWCSGLPLPGPVTVADRRYFQEARDTRAFAVGEYQLGRVTGKASLGFGYPILDQAGRVEAIAFAAMDLAWIEELVVEAHVPDGSSLAVVDQDGTVLARYPEPDRWVERSLSDMPLGQALAAQSEGITQSVGADGVVRLYAFTPLGRQPETPTVFVAVGVPIDAAYVAADQGLRTNLTILGVVSALTLVLALVNSELFIRRPLHTLLATMVRLGAGDLSARSPSGWGISELSQLAGAVDQMAEALEQREAARCQLEGQLARQAFYDDLTGLPNRVLLLDRLEHALVATARSEVGLAVLFLDLDRFKMVNDSLGHTGGDALLQAVAGRLVTCVRGGDTVARWGSDEFVALIQGASAAEVAQGVADRMLAALARPFVVDGREVVVSASIGIARCSQPAEVTASDALARDAASALRHAKANGKGRVVVFDPSMRGAALARMELEADLWRALEQGQLQVHYQPIVELATGRLEKVEALVRWAHPERGWISPADFIPLAEETGQIVPLGQWVLEQACQQMLAWQQQFPATSPALMSVNLSVRQFRNPELVRTIVEVLERTGLAPVRLKLEITESALMEQVEATIATLGELKALGIRLAIDDFGTGYSSLSYLKRLPVDTLKIDRSFVRGLGKDPQDGAIVRSIIGLAQSLHLSVTAEGIETAEQLAQLRAFGCDDGQGYYFARPLPPETLGALLAPGARFGHAPARRVTAA